MGADADAGAVTDAGADAVAGTGAGADTDTGIDRGIDTGTGVVWLADARVRDADDVNVTPVAALAAVLGGVDEYEGVGVRLGVGAGGAVVAGDLVMGDDR